MKMTEIMVCIAIFLIASVVFTESLINVRKSISKSEMTTKSISSVLNKDMLLRHEMRNIYIPYWKYFKKEYVVEKEKLLLFAKEKNIDVSSISAVYDDKSKTEGIEIVWNSGDRTFITREYIKQRIINEE